MSTAMESFDKSPLDAFVKSPLDARNAPGGRVLVWYPSPNQSVVRDDLYAEAYKLPSGMYKDFEVHSRLDWTGNIDDYSVVHFLGVNFTTGVLPAASEELYAGHRVIVYEDNEGGFFGGGSQPQRQSFANASGIILPVAIGFTPSDVFAPPNQDSIAAKGMTRGFHRAGSYVNATAGGGVGLHVAPVGATGFTNIEVLRDGLLFVYLFPLRSYTVAINPTFWTEQTVTDYQTLGKNFVEFGA